jgi:hypothetical protein
LSHFAAAVAHKLLVQERGPAASTVCRLAARLSAAEPLPSWAIFHCRLAFRAKRLNEDNCKHDFKKKKKTANRYGHREKCTIK